MLRLAPPEPLPLGRWCAANVFVAAAYYFAARIEELLPMAAGASTPVWPAAGVALVAVLMWGKRLAPGVWLGAFATNLWLDYNAHARLASVTLCAVTAVATMLAALFAGWAVRRRAQEREFFSGVRGVLEFLALGGLGFAFTNATLGTGVLLAFHKLPAASCFAVWDTWWRGDAVGIFLVAPLLLAWLPAQRESPPPRSLETFVCLALIFAAGFVIFSGDQFALLRTLPKDVFLALPFFLWASFRLNLRMLTLGMAVFATLAVLGTVSGNGPFQRAAAGDSLLVLDAVLAVLVCACLCLAALVRESRAGMATLAMSEDKFAKSFRSSPLGIALTTVTDGKFLDVNDSFLAMNGFAHRADVIGRTSVELGMWVDADERAMLVNRLRIERRVLNWRRPFRLRSGEVRVGLYSVELIELAGQECALLLVNDITEHERTEAALRQNELRLRLMAELIAGYSFAYAVSPARELRLEWLSQAGEKVLGFTEAELKTTVRFREHIHPDDRAEHQAKLNLVLAGVPEVMEFRFRTKSGAYRSLQSFNRPEWDAREGRIVRIVGAGQDITERRSSEQALRDSLEKTPNVCVQWYDAAGKILYWNHASQLTYGWSAAEAMQKNLGQLMFTPAQNAAFVAVLQQIKATGKTFGPQEFAFTRKDGRAGVCVSTVFSIPAPDGGELYVCTDIDITDRKQAEADRTVLVTQLQSAEDAERRRIARELHDSTAQQLAVLKLNLTLLKRNNSAIGTSLDDSLALTDQAIQEVRNFTWLLHPPLLDQLGLASALTGYVEGFARRTGLAVTVNTETFSGRLPDATELALFRVAQESLTNILRHAHSPDARLRLERDDAEVTLEIADRGQGLIVAEIKTGVGIAGMRERLRLVGGTLTIHSQPGGTQILATVPLPDRAVSTGARG
jgi:PAS domain S-box-containing protein